MRGYITRTRLLFKTILDLPSIYQGTISNNQKLFYDLMEENIDRKDLFVKKLWKC